MGNKDLLKYYDHVQGKSRFAFLRQMRRFKKPIISAIVVVGLITFFVTKKDKAPDELPADEIALNALVEALTPMAEEDNRLASMTNLERYLQYAEPTLEVKSETFIADNKIPLSASCFREGDSPAIRWNAAATEDLFPEAQSYVIAMEDVSDPENPVLHWLSYNIPATAAEIAEGASEQSGEQMLQQAVNDMGYAGYAAPCEPVGKKPYRIRVFALNDVLAPDALSSGHDIMHAMGDEIIQWGEYTVDHYFRL